MNHTDPTALWQHLVQWQPATAAALAQHIRALPDDWPSRVFGVGRSDAALTLPPGATGEQFPDRAPEIAPYDETAPLDDCPACTEVEGTCRWHEGYAAGHHEAVQAQLDAVRANPGMGLRQFMRWRSDVEEAEDRGEEPPMLPAAVSAVVSPPTSPPADPLREQVLDALDAPYCQTLGYLTPEALLDAYDASRAAVVAAPTSRAAVLLWAAKHLDSLSLSGVEAGVRAALTDELRRLAVEAQQQPAASPRNRRAFVHNAITDALSAAGDWVPLSVRVAATRAALEQVDAWHAAEPAPAEEQPAAADDEEA